MIFPKLAGIRLERKKDASLLNWNLKRPYPPEKIHVPIPSGSLPSVHIGDVVHAGQKIAVPIPINRSAAEIGAVQTTILEKKSKVWAEPAGPEGVSVHAGMPGVVERIAAFPDALGKESLMIEIRRQGEPKTVPATEPRKGWEQIPEEKLLSIFQNSGLVTTDPFMEPVHVKIGRHAGARTIIINGCEPEPYITCEQVLTMSHPVEILRGAELLRKAAGAVPIPINRSGAVPIPINFRGSEIGAVPTTISKKKEKVGAEIGAVPTTVDQKKIKVGAVKIIFALENSNLETLELIKSKIYFLKWEHVEVRTVPALYPQGLESTLLQAWFPGKEKEALVFPASTAFAVYEAVALQKPFFERVVTVGGECVVEPRSLWLPLGISFRDAIHACKGVMREPHKVLMGGPMAGTAQTTLEVPVMSGTTAVLALPKEVVKDELEEPCIRCKLCVDHCPVSLSPVMITLAAEQREFAVADEWGASDCVECGNCAYVCPSKRPMLELIRLARSRGKPAVAHA